MTEITIKCTDGSDPECKGAWVVDIGLDELTQDQVDTIEEEGGQVTIELTQEQFHANDLREGEIQRSPDDSRILYEIDVENTCSFCGGN